MIPRNSIDFLAPMITESKRVGNNLHLKKAEISGTVYCETEKGSIVHQTLLRVVSQSGAVAGRARRGLRGGRCDGG